MLLSSIEFLIISFFITSTIILPIADVMSPSDIHQLGKKPKVKLPIRQIHRRLFPLLDEFPISVGPTGGITRKDLGGRVEDIEAGLDGGIRDSGEGGVSVGPFLVGWCVFEVVTACTNVFGGRRRR